jgi:hypothetical protein
MTKPNLMKTNTESKPALEYMTKTSSTSTKSLNGASTAASKTAIEFMTKTASTSTKSTSKASTSSSSSISSKSKPAIEFMAKPVPTTKASASSSSSSSSTTKPAIEFMAKSESTQTLSSSTNLKNALESAGSSLSGFANTLKSAVQKVPSFVELADKTRKESIPTFIDVISTKKSDSNRKPLSEDLGQSRNMAADVEFIESKAQVEASEEIAVPAAKKIVSTTATSSKEFVSLTPEQTVDTNAAPVVV